jgi:RNase P subunit RPR2
VTNDTSDGANKRKIGRHKNNLSNGFNKLNDTEKLLDNFKEHFCLNSSKELLPPKEFRIRGRGDRQLSKTTIEGYYSNVQQFFRWPKL